MNIEPIFLDKDSLARLTRSFDLSALLAAYVADLGVSLPTIASFAFSEATGGLTLANPAAYGGNPGVTFDGGTAGETYLVRLTATLSNGDKPVVKIHVAVS